MPGAVVHEQVRLGSLLVSPIQKLGQDADYLWHQANVVWVGDAKYKCPIGDEWPKIDEVRQLICYGQLATQRHPGKASRLMLLHRTTDAETSEEWQTFEGQPLRLQSVRVAKSS